MESSCDVTIDNLDEKVAQTRTKYSEHDESKMSKLWKELKGDKIHILLLFFLYILQGVPIGIKMSMPLILQRLSVPYSDQAVFSIARYPYSMKVLWAPIVDALFIKRFGRRKSWIIPTQYLTGNYYEMLPHDQ